MRNVGTIRDVGFDVVGERLARARAGHAELLGTHAKACRHRDDILVRRRGDAEVPACADVGALPDPRLDRGIDYADVDCRADASLARNREAAGDADQQQVLLRVHRQVAGRRQRGAGAEVRLRVAGYGIEVDRAGDSRAAVQPGAGAAGRDRYEQVVGVCRDVDVARGNRRIGSVRLDVAIDVVPGKGACERHAARSLAHVERKRTGHCDHERVVVRGNGDIGAGGNNDVTARKRLRDVAHLVQGDVTG